MLLLLLLVISTVYASAQKESWPETPVIWVQHQVSSAETHLNNALCDSLPPEILSHYVARGYKLEAHTMAEKKSRYDTHHESYSWTLVKYPATVAQCVQELINIF
jgi:hypothetical protein